MPTACADFPKEIIWSPRRWLETRYNITRWTEMPRGGHFAALEQPELLVDDVARSFGRCARNLICRERMTDRLSQCWELAVGYLSRSLRRDRARELSRDETGERVDRLCLFAAILQLDGEDSHTSGRRHHGYDDRSPEPVVAADDTRLGGSECRRGRIAASRGTAGRYASIW